MSKYAIVAIGYNRIKSMERLLNSLKKADYDNDQITLIVSVDNSGNDSVARFAEEFPWPHGEKRVRTFKERQGLRRHVLSCGDFLEEYDAIAVFEDDIYVSPGFFHYMKAAVKFYENDEHIAGISLYNHLWNVNTNRPFFPKADKYDTYFMQFAQSWGQIWMKRQWREFRRWYDTQGEEFEVNPQIPDYVSAWPKTSWLKYHIKYCIDRNKYFVYPYTSLTTNFTDAGENFAIPSIGFQVPMQMDIRDDYKFPEFIEGKIKYDAFFENKGLGEYLVEKLNIKEEDICIDLYATKKNRMNKRYWLTMEVMDHQIIKSFGLLLKPQEENIYEEINGNQIFLYDTVVHEKNPYKQNEEGLKCNYDHRGDNLSLKTLLALLKNKVIRQLKGK